MEAVQLLAFFIFFGVSVTSQDPSFDITRWQSCTGDPNAVRCKRYADPKLRTCDSVTQDQIQHKLSYYSETDVIVERAEQMKRGTFANDNELVLNTISNKSVPYFENLRLRYSQKILEIESGFIQTLLVFNATGSINKDVREALKRMSDYICARADAQNAFCHLQYSKDAQYDRLTAQSNCAPCSTNTVQQYNDCLNKEVEQLDEKLNQVLLDFDQLTEKISRIGELNFKELLENINRKSEIELQKILPKGRIRAHYLERLDELNKLYLKIRQNYHNSLITNDIKAIGNNLTASLKIAVAVLTPDPQCDQDRLKDIIRIIEEIISPFNTSSVPLLGWDVFIMRYGEIDYSSIIKLIASYEETFRNAAKIWFGEITSLYPSAFSRMLAAMNSIGNVLDTVCASIEDLTQDEVDVLDLLSCSVAAKSVSQFTTAASIKSGVNNCLKRYQKSTAKQ